MCLALGGTKKCALMVCFENVLARINYLYQFVLIFGWQEIEWWSLEYYVEILQGNSCAFKMLRSDDNIAVYSYGSL